MSKYKDYIGDAVYVDFDGWHIVLTTEDGITVSNRICLEPGLLQRILAYEKRIHSVIEAEKKVETLEP